MTVHDTPSEFAGETDGSGSYELHVYALSPEIPSPRRLVAEAAGGGLPVELDPGTDQPELDAPDWTSLRVRNPDGAGASVCVSVSDALARLLDVFREDIAAGEEVPEQVLHAQRLYLLELPLDGAAEDDESQQAALVLAAWALAGLTEGLVFDPQEEFFADAESFWALVMDDSPVSDLAPPPTARPSA